MKNKINFVYLWPIGLDKYIKIKYIDQNKGFTCMKYYYWMQLCNYMNIVSLMSNLYNNWIFSLTARLLKTKRIIMCQICNDILYVLSFQPYAFLSKSVCLVQCGNMIWWMSLNMWRKASMSHYPIHTPWLAWLYSSLLLLDFWKLSKSGRVFFD